MDPNDPDSGYPTPRDDADELDATTQSQFVPIVTSTPKETTQLARLNLNPLSDRDRVTEEEGSSQTSHDDPNSPDQRLKKNMQHNKLQRELKRERSKTEKLKRENDELLHENSALKDNLDKSMSYVEDKDATIEALNKSVTNLMETNSKITADFEVQKLNDDETESELGVLRENNNKFKKNMVEKEDCMQQLQEELEGAQRLATHKADENIRLISTIDTTRQELENVKQERDQLLKKYEDEKETSLEQIALLKESLAQTESNRLKIKKQCDVGMKDFEALSQKHGQLQALVAEMKVAESDLYSKIQVLTQDVSDCHKSCDQWKLQANECKQNAEVLQKDNTDLNLRIDEKSHELEQFTRYLQRQKEDYKSLTEKCLRQSVEFDGLKETLTEDIKRVNDSLEDSRRKELQLMEAQLEVKKELDDRDAVITNLYSEIDGLKGDMTGQQEESDRNLQTLTEKNTKLELLVCNSKEKESSLHTRITTLQDNVSYYKKNCDNWKQDADQCKTDIEMLDKERINLKTDVGVKAAEIAQLTIKFKKLQVGFDEAIINLLRQTSELDSLKEKEKDFLDTVQQIKEAGDQIKLLQEEVQTKNNTMKEQEESLRQLQEKVAEFDKMSAEFVTFRTDCKSRIQTLTEDIKRVNALLEESSYKQTELTEEQQQLEKVIQDKDFELKNLYSEVDGLKGDATVRQDASKKNLKVLTEKNKELELLLSNFQENESNLHDQIKTLQGSVSDFRKSCNDWKHEADRCKVEIETLEKERTNLNTDVCGKTAEIAQLTVDFEKLQLDLDETIIKLSQQTSELDSLKEKEKDFLDAVKQIKEAGDQIKFLQEEVQTKNNMLKGQNESLRQLQGKVAEFDSKSAEFEIFRVDYVSRIKLLSDANAQFKASAEEARQMENQMINDQVQLKNEVSSKKNKVESLNREIAKLKEAERHLQDQLNGDKEVSELLTEEKQMNSQLSDKLSEYEKINRGLADENSYLRDHFGNRPHPVELAGVQQELDRKTLELEDIKKEKGELLNEREQMNSDLLARMEDIENKKTEIEDLLDDIKVANEELAKQKYIIGKLVQEHNDFVEDAHERETELEAAQIRLQELEALDGYPGRSIELDKHDESIGSRESKQMYHESLVREIETLRSTLDGERTRIRELKSDMRNKDNEFRELRSKLKSVDGELRQADLNVEHYRQLLNTVEQSLTEKEAHLSTIVAENSTNQLALAEVKRFLTVDHPRDVLEYEQKIRLLSADVERKERDKNMLRDDFEKKEDEVFKLTAHVKSLGVELREVKADLLRKRKLITVNLDTVQQLRKKMESQDNFITRIRDRNGARQHVIDSMVIKLDKAYDELGRLPNWGNYPRKKERWDQEEEEDHTALDSIENDMQNILRNSDSEMFRSAGNKIAQESARNSRNSERSIELRQPFGVRQPSADASRRSTRMSSVPPQGSQARRQLVSTSKMEKENRQVSSNTTASTDFNMSHKSANAF